MDVRTIRAQFPDAEKYAYFDNASRSILPVSCIEAMGRFASIWHRAGFEQFPEYQQLLPDLRSQIASLLHSSPEEIALSWNTSVPLNTAAQSFPLEPGDRVLVGRSEFPANVYVWENLARKGVEVTILPPGKGYTTVEDIRSALDARTKIVAVSFVSFHNGYRADLEEIGKLCKDAGAVLAVDAIQGLGVVETDVRACNVGILASGGQKWLLSPCGTGFLFCSSEVMRNVWPCFAGWLNVKGADPRHRSILGTPFDPVDDARRFEVGTLAFHDLVGFRESLKLILSVGVKEIQKHVLGLLDVLVEELRSLPVTIQSPLGAGERSGILSFACEDSTALKESLVAERVIVAEREGAVRVSPHLYNNLEDIEKLCRALKKFFGRAG
ncbi:MAG: aminotransferase class V-fold PLP-dependent enzyme [Candidatus Eiseniibacteriota bacterium]|nr:MAG: aminotransferase class V-fold PLP-dependent enzyme [Candidatus Eisenbacteria bacterium]